MLLGPFYRRPRRWRRGCGGGGPADYATGFNGGGGVAKMASHAIFQYNVLVIDIDNTTLGLI